MSIDEWISLDGIGIWYSHACWCMSRWLCHCFYGSSRLSIKTIRFSCSRCDKYQLWYTQGMWLLSVQRARSTFSIDVLVWLYTERNISDSLSKSHTSFLSILCSCWLARWYLCFTISCWQSFRIFDCVLLGDVDVLWIGRLCRRNTKDCSSNTRTRWWVNFHGIFSNIFISIRSFSWSKIEGLRLLHTPEISVVTIRSDVFNVYYLLDGLRGKGWHLNGLQNPPG